MLVVISDLHFEEEESDIIRCGGGRVIAFERNLPSVAFEQFMARVAAEAVRNGASSVNLVLAGDIFDIHRTQLWFQGPGGTTVRPYESCASVQQGSILEKKILTILDAIAAESAVHESLAVFKRFAAGKYWRVPGDQASEESFDVPVGLHYLPGNHDRLANATPLIRKAVRALLGMPPSGDPFDHTFVPPDHDPMVLVRHGHEYDHVNFAAALAPKQRIPANVPAAAYDGPTFGDFATVDIAMGLPWFFRRIHDDKTICNDPTLERVYLRLLEFDDVRPQSALLEFLLDMPGGTPTRELVWGAIAPVVVRLLEKARGNVFLRRALRSLQGHWLLKLLVPALLFLRVWRAGLPLWLFKLAYRWAAGPSKEDSPELYASREVSIADGSTRFLIAGHTHNPEVELIGSKAPGDQYYVDTGTWRNRVKATSDRALFGRLKALTYVIVYSSTEDLGKQPSGKAKRESFDYWSGFTQRWPLGDRNLAVGSAGHARAQLTCPTLATPSRCRRTRWNFRRSSTVWHSR